MNEPIAETDALLAVNALLATDPTSFQSLGATPPSALLLSGPPGVGKTHAVRTAAHTSRIPLNVVTPGPNIYERLKQAFLPPSQHQNPSSSSTIVFIDEIDTICPNHPAINRATCFLLARIGRQTPDHFVYVIGATNRPNAIDPRLRTAGRFDREASLHPPSAKQRFHILTVLQPAVDPDVLSYIADRAAGFVAADLVALSTEAHSKQLPSHLTPANALLHAFRRAKPSILRNEFAVELPNSSWKQVGGLSDVKRRLQMAIEWPMRYSATFNRLGLVAPRGILLHGPPGCSKTTLVRAAASGNHVAFLTLNGADIYSCYLGEAERILRQAFVAARAAAPCVLFLDELDAVVGKRSTSGEQTDGNGVQERVLSTLLTEMDGVLSMSGVLVIGATNRLDLLDDALIRPGRFDDVLKVDLPDETSRLEIMKIHSSALPIGDDVDLSEIAALTQGRSGADIKALCSEAALTALREQFTLSARGSEEGSGDVRVARKHFAI